MSTIKRIILTLVGFIFRTSLFFGLTILAIILVVNKPDNIKNAINDVDGYQRFRSAFVDSAKKTSKDDNSIPFDRPEISSALEQALNDAKLKEISNAVIDSGYNWLNKNTQKIEFKVDITNDKQTFADSVASYATTRLNTLPQCFKPTTNNVFDVNCFPYGTNLADIRTQVTDSIMSSDNLLPKNSIDQSILPKTDGLSIDQKYPKIPTYFQYFKLSPFVLLFISFLCALIIIYSSRTKRYGLKTVGSTILSTAIILAVTPIIYVYVLPRLGFGLPKFGEDQSQAFSGIFSDISNNLYSQLNVMLINIAIQTAILGAVILIITKFIKSNSSMYVDLDRKVGLSVSEPKKNKFTDKDNKNIPIQTSEGPKQARKKVSKFEKKYRKM